MKEVNIALHSATQAERDAVKHWLHPAHTADSILMNLGWFDDLKKDAASVASHIKTDASKAIHWTEGAAHTIEHGVEVAGQKCGSNPICV